MHQPVLMGEGMEAVLGGYYMEGSGAIGLRHSAHHGARGGSGWRVVMIDG